MLQHRWGMWDWIAAAAFAVVAVKFQVYCLHDGDPFIVLNADSGNVTSFLAAWLQPELFATDLVLDDRAKYGVYVTLVLPVVAFIHLFEPDLGRAFAYQMWPLVFFHMLGFYVLGRRLLGGRGYAALLACITLVPVWTIPGELWGMNDVPLVRMAYASVFPWLLVLCLTCYEQPRRVYVVALAAGLASYVHLVSGPSVAGACFVGLLALRPAGVDAWSWLVRLAGAAAAYLVCVAPYVYVYLSAFPSGAADGELTATLQSWSAYVDLGAGLGTLMDAGERGRVAWGGRWIVWLAGAVGLIVGAFTLHDRQRLYRFLLLLTVGLALTSVGVTYVDQTVNGWFGRNPVQVDLQRNARYLLPLLLIGLLFLIQFGWRSIRRAPAVKGVRGINVLVVLFVFASLSRFAVPYVNLFLPGMMWIEFSDASSRLQAQAGRGATQALGYLRDLPHGSTKVLPIADDVLALAIRYAAQKPVVWAAKDQNLLVYTSHPQITRWVQLGDLVSDFRYAGDVTAAASAVCSLVRTSDADLVLVDRRQVTASAWAALASIGEVVFAQTDVVVVRPEAEACVA